MTNDITNPQQRVERLLNEYSAAAGNEAQQDAIQKEIVKIFPTLSVIAQGELLRRFEAEAQFSDRSFMSLRDFPEGPATDKSTPGSRVTRTPGLDIQERHPSQR